MFPQGFPSNTNGSIPQPNTQPDNNLYQNQMQPQPQIPNMNTGMQISNVPGYLQQPPQTMPYDTFHQLALQNIMARNERVVQMNLQKQLLDFYRKNQLSSYSKTITTNVENVNKQLPGITPQQYLQMQQQQQQQPSNMNTFQSMQIPQQGNIQEEEKENLQQNAVTTEKSQIIEEKMPILKQEHQSPKNDNSEINALLNPGEFDVSKITDKEAIQYINHRYLRQNNNKDDLTPLLMQFTIDFPGWHLDEIFDYMQVAKPRDILLTQYEIVKAKQEKLQAEEEKKKKQLEDQQQPEPYPPRIRTRHWKDNENNRKQAAKDGSKTNASEKSAKSASELNDDFVLYLLKSNDYDSKVAFSKIQQNVDFYKNQLVLSFK